MATPSLVLLGIQESCRIPVISAIRSVFGVSIRAARDLTDEPFPKTLPELPEKFATQAREALIEAGADMEPLDLTPKPEVELKDIWERLADGDDLF